MAELFLARARGIEGFETLVAVKRILPQLAVNGEFVRMFLDEARLAAQLRHPNIAQVYDIGKEAGAHFFVMEYVAGHDLRDVLTAAGRAGGLPLEHALTIVAGVAAGLHHAHEHTGPDGKTLGIVHRDLSPRNVLCSFTGAVKLVDFGIAKVRNRQTDTRDGTLKGKLAYMSPEQCRAEPLDRRSDIFALGLLLYELTTGQRAFDEDLEYRLINLVAAGSVVAPSARVRGYPKELEPIVMKALQPARADRYATAEELQLDLESYAQKAHLALSTANLRRYMRALFPEEIPAVRRSTEAAPVRGYPDTVELDADLPDGSSVPAVHRRRWLAEAGALVALVGVIVVIFSLVRGGSDPVAPPVTPAKALAPTPPPPTPPPAPPTRPPAPPTPPPPAAEPEPAAVVTPAAAPEPPPPTPVKKSKRKKRPAWDPDSPFLPKEHP